MLKIRGTRSSNHEFTVKVLIVGLTAIMLLIPTISTRSVYATHLGTSSQVWGIEAAVIAKIHHFDPTTDTATAISRVPTLSMENGRGMASDGTNLWYTFLIEGFHGDGKIHKIAPTGGPDIATIPDPFGFNGSGLSGLDFDSGYLWAISSYPIQPGQDPVAKVFKIDSNTGTVLTSCDLPFVYEVTGTFAIVNGKILTHTDAHSNHLNEYNPPSTIGGNCASTGNVFTLPVNVSGIDTDSAGNLLATDFHSLYNLGHAPYSTILASQPNGFGQFVWESDITTQPELNVQTSICPEGNVQHWDKIIFTITDPHVAQRVNVTVNTELDIKVQDDPQKVADIKQKVADFLKLPSADKRAIKILNVDYAIICAMLAQSSSQTLPPLQSQSNVSSSTAAAMAKVQPESLFMPRNKTAG